MFVVGERIDRGNAGVVREFFHVALCESADDRALNHSRENAGSVLDRLASAELNIVCIQKKRLAAQLANAHFEGNAGAR